MISLTGVFPNTGSSQNDTSSLVEFTLKDESSVGINISTLVVEISGVRAVEGASFLTGFDGEYSDISIDIDTASVVINKVEPFQVGKTINVKIQVQDYFDKYYNFDYSFKTISDIPYIFDSNPRNKDNWTSPQKIYFDIRDDLENLDVSSLEIYLSGNKIYQDEFLSPFQGSQSKISHSTESLEITLDHEEFLRDGNYKLKVIIKDLNQNVLNKTIDFSVKYISQPLPPVFPEGGFLGFYQGITRVTDVGDGKNIDLEWSTPISRFYNSDIYSLVFYDTDRLSIFDSAPKYLAKGDITTLRIEGLKVGTGYYFAVRAMESYKDSIDTSGMEEYSNETYIIPNPTTLTSVLSNEDTTIDLASVDGLPESGFLIINTEVIKYTAIDRNNNRVFVPPGGRGLNNTVAVYHDIGESAKMFLLCQDDNTSIIYGTTTYQDPVSTGRENNSVGIIVPDFSDFEKMTHDGLDHCGYHKPLPWEALSGKDDCGTYLGGVYNGFRGIDIFQRAMDREEELMENVGEKCVLFRRKWSGETCSCVTLRRQHPKIRSCRFCYGTGFVGGYDQIFNLRRQDKRTLIRFYEAQEDLKLGDHSHLQQEFQPTALALFKPIIKDRDLIVRFDYTDDIEYIYEVLNVNRERFVFNKYGRQKLSIIRLDKTDIVYHLKYES